MKIFERDKIDSKKLLNVVYLLFFAGLAVFALLYCLKNIRFDEFISHLKSADYFLVALSALTGFLATVVRAFRWNIMLKPLGYRQSVFDTYNSLMTGYLANLAIPRIGELIRCTTLNKTGRIPVNSSFGTVVTERIFDLACLMLILLLTFLLKMNIFSQFFAEKVFPQWRPVIEKVSAVSIVSVIVGAAVLAALFFIVKYMLGKIRMDKAKKILKGMLAGMKSIFKMEQRMQFMLCTVTIWTCYWLSGFLIFKALPFTSHLGPADGLFMMSLGTLGWVVPAPGAFGTFHFIVALGLTMYNIPSEQGFSVAALSHESQLLLMVLLGLLSVLSVSTVKTVKNK